MKGGHPDKVPLTQEEENAINTLRRLKKRWPESLWLFATGMSVHVMRNDKHGHHAEAPTGGGMCSGYSVASINIENDGGDW